jgi:arylsulfatase A-like enzyme
MCPHFCVPARELPSGSGTLQPARIRSGHSTELFSGAAVDFLRSRGRDDDRPFFLYVAFTAPHDPRETHYRFRSPYHQPPPLPENFLPQHPLGLDRCGIRDEALAEFPRDPEEVRMHLGDYYAMITHMDEGIGRIHQALAEAGLEQDTIVVHTADHGLGVGSHGIMGKQCLHDHSVRVPLIVAGPGFERGAVDDRLCYQHDLHPTLLASAGIERPCDYAHLQSASRRTHVGCSYASTMRSIQAERYKLIEYNLPEGRHTQLFDMQNDPHELHDLSASDAHSPTLASLRQALGDHMQRADDPMAEAFR